MIKPQDLPIDIQDIASEVEAIVAEETEDLADVGVILGQLDPTEIDLKTGLPRWTPEQMTIIVKLNDRLREWQD